MKSIQVGSSPRRKVNLEISNQNQDTINDPAETSNSRRDPHVKLVPTINKKGIDFRNPSPSIP